MPSVDILFRLRRQRPDVFDKVEGNATVLSCPSQCHNDYHSIHRRWNPTGNRYVFAIPFRQFINMATLSDVLKCVCLGARAVGLGRPVLYAQSVSLL